MAKVNIENEVAKSLLQINAIKLSPANPFTWASGWNSPIYCDNRKTLSFPEVRTYIKNCFVDIIKEKYPNAEVIAGVATGAIAQGALVAEALGLPFVYVRSAAKGHGLENLIEGTIKEGQKVVVIEDLISTGGSSLKAVNALRTAKTEVLGMLAIFTYGFETAVDNFKNAECELETLSNYETLISFAKDSNFVKESEVQSLNEWRINPAVWGK